MVRLYMMTSYSVRLYSRLKLKSKFGLAILLAAGFMMTLSVGCGPKAFVKGEYDSNVEKENLLNDQWSETDMQKIVKAMTESLVAHPAISQAKEPPVVIITQLQNKTSEHIDTQSVMDMVRVELMKTGRLSFIDKEARDDVKQETDYVNSTNGPKQDLSDQAVAQFMINGRLDSIVQEVGKDKTVFYKVTLNLTNIKKNQIVWSDYKQIRKQYRKRSIGL